MQKQLIFGLMKSLHDLFTALWIGGLLTTALTFLPTIKKFAGKPDESKKLIKQYLHIIRVIVVISILGLWITGMLLSRRANLGFINFSTPAAALLSVKHLIIFLMVAVALYRGFVLGRKVEQFSMVEQKWFTALLVINAILGVVVIFLSGFGAVLG